MEILIHKTGLISEASRLQSAKNKEMECGKAICVYIYVHTQTYIPILASLIFSLTAGIATWNPIKIHHYLTLHMSAAN